MVSQFQTENSLHLELLERSNASSFFHLKSLSMQDRDYGWTVEMQIKAARHRIRVQEVPVSYRRRIGTSKISGNLKGVLGAGFKILSTIFLSALHSRFRRKTEREEIIIFTRYPEPGKTKTRLIPALGPVGAADLQRQMTEYTLVRVKDFAKRNPLSIEVCYEGGDPSLLRSWLGSDLSCHPQGSGDLGVRLSRAFSKAFEAGMRMVVVIGTDCPGLTDELIQQSFEALKRTEVVLGPAADGGYYLVGLRRPIPELFMGISWGTSEVFEQTRRILTRLGMTPEVLPLLRDVDRPEDLSILGKERRSFSSQTTHPRISIIVAALNEGKYIGAVLAGIKGASNSEVIVVDGGSHDETVAVARASGARVLSCAPGRAAQMNQGAAVAGGEILLFLHADTLLPEQFNDFIRDTLARPHVVAGAFELGINGPGRGLRMIERLANWRSRRLRMPYGDQGIFLRASLFWEVGGFPDVPIMEDFDLIRRLQKRGRIATAPVRVLTSARRWERTGLVRTTLMNQAMIVGHLIGISPGRLARWYNRNEGVV